MGMRCDAPEHAKRIPPAIQRLMDEVRNGDVTPQGLFDRSHNRHNRSGG
jgi:hypothetical protein